MVNLRGTSNILLIVVFTMLVASFASAIPQPGLCTQDEVFVSCSGSPDSCGTYGAEQACIDVGCDWTTGSPVVTGLYYTGFEASSAGWSDPGDDAFRSSSRSSCLDNGADGGSYSFNLQDDSSSSYTERTFDFSGYTSVDLAWEAYYDSLESGECLEVKCDGTVVGTFCEGSFSENTWVSQSVNIDGGDCTLDSNVVIRFEAEFSTNFDDVWLDCIDVDGNALGQTCTGNPDACSTYQDDQSCLDVGCDPNCRDKTSCGDGTVQTPNEYGQTEECDDSGNVDGDGCTSDCLNEYCGDSTVQAGLGEECDDGGNADNDGCSANCLNEYCGDGTQQSSEECEDGNNADGDGCSANCALEDTCDTGLFECIGNSNACDTYSQQSYCSAAGCSWTAGGGSGVTKWSENFASNSDWTGWSSEGYGLSYEYSSFYCINDGNDDCVELDGGSSTEYLEKNSNIDLSSCLDGTAVFHIAKVNNDDSSNDASDCAKVWFSSNSGGSWGDVATIVCDDTNVFAFQTAIPNAYLVSTMRLRIEKEGYTDFSEHGYLDGFSITCDEPGEGECTGDPNACETYDTEQVCLDVGCDFSCVEAFCGDGNVDPGEECDDSNNADNDGCDANCFNEYCGDSILQSSEQCDDGGNVDNDGCNAQCVVEYCGDGILHPTLGEQCDDGNNFDGDECSKGCLVETPPMEVFGYGSYYGYNMPEYETRVNFGYGYGYGYIYGYNPSTRSELSYQASWYTTGYEPGMYELRFFATAENGDKWFQFKTKDSLFIELQDHDTGDENGTGDGGDGNGGSGNGGDSGSSVENLGGGGYPGGGSGGGGSVQLEPLALPADGSPLQVEGETELGTGSGLELEPEEALVEEEEEETSDEASALPGFIGSWPFWILIAVLAGGLLVFLVVKGMNKSGKNYRSVLSVLFTVSVITVLVIVGPAQAVKLFIHSPSDTAPYVGDIVGFTVEVDIETDEVVPIKTVSLEVNGVECVFSAAGGATLSTDEICQGFFLTKISSSAITNSPKYGYEGMLGDDCIGEQCEENHVIALFNGYGYGYRPPTDWCPPGQLCVIEVCPPGFPGCLTTIN
ncbi:DUF4215 domain-containing protein [Nanoarchaeota archaeon]